jgi:hypothetical protein
MSMHYFVFTRRNAQKKGGDGVISPRGEGSNLTQPTNQLTKLTPEDVS